MVRHRRSSAREKDKLAFFNLPWKNFPDTLDREFLVPFRANSSVYIPQMLAFIANTMTLVRSDNYEGHYWGFTPTLSRLGSELQNGSVKFDSGEVCTQEEYLNILRVLNTPTRSYILKDKQTNPNTRRYSTSVPLVLSAFKQYKNINYSSWDWSDPSARFFLDSDTLDLVPYFVHETVASKDIDLCDAVLADYDLVKARSALGGAVTRVKLREFKDLPHLLRLQLLQLWVYDPDNWNDYSLLDVRSLDSRPAKLISSDIPLLPINSISPWQQ